MALYLLKSTACLALFIAFYKAFLEQEQMHLFKRFYLLAILVLSFSIPSIVFTEYIEIQETFAPKIKQVLPSALEASTEDSLRPKTMDWPSILWSIYAVGVFIFGLKFLKNLLEINHRIRKNNKIRAGSNIKVLLEEAIVPHTFLRYIFLNQKKYLENQIPTTVLLHEETHAKQKHTVDVLFIEFVQTIFWFNPLIYALKNAIKLNHEFLADQAVLQEGTHLSTYQKTILSYSSIHQPPLANAINYSSIKKRFTVMKKRTSKQSVLLRSFLLLPLLVLMLYGFSNTKVVNKIPKETSVSYQITNIITADEASEKELALYNRLAVKYNAVPIENRVIPLNDLKVLKTLYGNMSDGQKEKAESFPECLPQEQTTAINIHVNKKGKLLVQDDPVALKDLPNFLSNIHPKLSIAERKRTVASIIHAETGAPKEVIQQVDNILAEYGSATINIVGPEDSSQTLQQQSASRSEMKEYNALAKKYNTMARNQMRIKLQDVQRLKVIYGKMSKKQRDDAEPFPDFPEPPPAPKAPNQPPIAEPTFTPKTVKTKEPTSPQAPPTPPKPISETMHIKEGKIVSHQVSGTLSAPPTPPTPPNPLDHIVAMAKKGARFYFEGKEISSDEAIKLIKKNDDLNIKSQHNNGAPPEVRITKSF
jgi:biopolymer transport protein ExbD